MKTCLFLAGYLLLFIPMPAFSQVLPSFNKSYSSLNNNVWGYRTNPITGNKWDIDMYIYPKGSYTLTNVTNTATQLGGLATAYGTFHDGIHEWGYSFHNLNGMWSGDGWFIVSGPYKGYTHPPVNRADAYQMMRAWFVKQVDSMRNVYPSYFRSTTGHELYHHYGARWAGNKIDMISCEIGENIKSTQVHVAFTRGAARQYGKPWGLQLSPWYGPGILDYSVPGMWAESGSNNGHSLEMFKRSYFISFMAGGNVHHLEAANVNWFNGETKDANGNFFLSPLGNIGKDFYDATQRIGNGRGIPYTPYAIVLDSLHGINQYPTAWLGAPQYKDTTNTIWEWFDPLPGDLMSRSLFNTIWPGSFQNSPNDDNEQNNFLTASPHGDLFDVFTEDVSLAVLQKYPVIYLSGNIVPGTTFAGTLQSYVSGGGTLIMNAAQITSAISNTFTGISPGSNATTSPSKLIWASGPDTVNYSGSITARGVTLGTATVLMKGKLASGNVPLMTKNNYGAGKVIVTLPDYLADQNIIDLLLKELNKELLPVKIQGTVEYLVNKTTNGWNITVINNKGVSKVFNSPAVIDNAQQQTVTVTYAESGYSIGSVTELRGQQAVTFSGNTFQDVVAPGEVKVYNIVATTPGYMQRPVHGFPGFVCYPNPAHEYTVLNFPVGLEVITAGTDMNGRPVRILNKKGTEPIYYDVSTLPAGIYMMKVVDVKKRTQKVVKFLKI